MKLLSKDEMLARNEKYTPKNLMRWKDTIGFPAPTKIGKFNYWSAEDVDKWEAKQISRAHETTN